MHRQYHQQDNAETVTANHGAEYTYCNVHMEKIVAWSQSMPGQHPAPHDQEPLHCAVCQKHGMILVPYCRIDQKTVMVKLHNALACRQQLSDHLLRPPNE